MYHSRVSTYCCQSIISASLITKEYLLEDYVDVFQGIGALPRGSYHIRLKQCYQPLQHPPHSVPVVMHKAFREEVDRLLLEGIIAKVHEHTEWVNSIEPVPKPDDTIRLCLDPKGQNKAIKGNQWNSRTMDDILPELKLLHYK